LSSTTYLFILGGDSFDNTVDQTNLAPGEMDRKWERGYKNDVWKSSGTDWEVYPDIRLRSRYGRKRPVVKSTMKWQRVTAGNHPPVGMSNDEWIGCQSYFQNQPKYNCSDRAAEQVQWSPRRNFAGVYFRNQIFVMGGRAREFLELSEAQSIGGIIGPRVEDIPTAQQNAQQLYTTQREKIVLKNDVWSSYDGISWTLVTPGCKAPQSTLLATGNAVDQKTGTLAEACSKDADCYGAETCDSVLKTCVCLMWSPRESFSLAASGNNLYVVGGFASALYSGRSTCGGYPCGATAAGDYRYYMNDVWMSSNGQTWFIVTPAAFTLPNPVDGTLPPVNLGRGGHAMIAFQSSQGDYQLWVFGGRGGDNQGYSKNITYYNDIWFSSLGNGSGLPIKWDRLFSPNNPINNPSILEQGKAKSSTTSYNDDGNSFIVNSDDEFLMPWSPRAFHAVSLEESSPQNLYTRTLYLYGGYYSSSENGTSTVSTANTANTNGDGYLDDMWTWRLDDSKEYWRRDFSKQELYGIGSGSDLRYQNSSPAYYYVSPDSPISFMRRFWIPAKPRSVSGLPYQLRSYLTDYDIQSMQSIGIMTISDLAQADKYAILKLRGYDVPEVAASDRLSVDNICDYRAFAIAIVDKCSLNTDPDTLYAGQLNMPWKITPEFGGPVPFQQTLPKWYGRKNYDFLSTVDDPVTLLDTWDGCTYIASIEGLFGPNVNGIGYVTQVTSIADPTPEVQNLFCKQYPAHRAYHSMVVFDGLVYLIAGKSSDTSFHADTWYRDAFFPSTKILTAPRSHTDDHTFVFSSNKAGVVYEYRLWDPINYKEIRPWNPVVSKTGVVWLNWRRNGPGSGYYQMYVRAIDPAGNSDVRFGFAIKNAYYWYYVSPIPYDIIGGCLAAFIGLCFFAYLEYRRRVKKAAMERYAMKRMRRKFKAMQRDIDGKAVDWRTLYLESKQQEEAGLKIDKRKLKKVRDENEEKREKEKKKREKEKELIKKKLKANKEMKEKKKECKAGSKLSDNIDDKTKTKATTKGGSSTSTKKVVPGDDVEVEGGDEENALIEGDGQGKRAKSAGGGGGGGRGSGLSGKVAAAADRGDLLSKSSQREIKAGDLASSKNTELGFKQRKQNKLFKNYESADGKGMNFT
jgi:hypothetical protein